MAMRLLRPSNEGLAMTWEFTNSPYVAGIGSNGTIDLGQV
jgi:hypothetical protein